jgi:hypothetical protein
MESGVWIIRLWDCGIVFGRADILRSRLYNDSCLTKGL